MAWRRKPSVTHQQQVKKGSQKVTVTLNLRTQEQRGCQTPTEARGGEDRTCGHAPTSIPTPSLLHTPKRPGRGTKHRGAVWTGLCPCGVTLASCPQFPHPESEAKPPWPPPHGLWAQHPRPTAARKLQPAPHADRHRLPRHPVCAHAGYLRSGRRMLPPPETCRLRGSARAPELRGPRRPPARPQRLPRS